MKKWTEKLAYQDTISCLAVYGDSRDSEELQSNSELVGMAHCEPPVYGDSRDSSELRSNSELVGQGSLRTPPYTATAASVRIAEQF